MKLSDKLDDVIETLLIAVNADHGSVRSINILVALNYGFMEYLNDLWRHIVQHM